MSTQRMIDIFPDWTPPLGYDMITSPIFTFYIGPERKEFVVHSQLFRDTSPPLHTMINGSMQEAQQRYVDLVDTDPLVFAALVEYAYTGFYAGTLLKADELYQPASPSASPQEESISTDLIYNESWQEFSRMQNTFTKAEHDFYDAAQDRYSPTESTAMILHINVAALADQWLMVDLKRRALSYIWNELWAAEDGHQRWLLSMLKAYLEHPDPVEDIKRIFRSYFAGTYKTFESSQRFKDLLEEYPDFELDLLRIISKYAPVFVR